MYLSYTKFPPINHLENSENVPPLEVLQLIYQYITSDRTFTSVAFSDFTVNSFDYFLSKAGLF